jgi:hypothetical protein
VSVASPPIRGPKSHEQLERLSKPFEVDLSWKGVALTPALGTGPSRLIAALPVPGDRPLASLSPPLSQFWERGYKVPNWYFCSQPLKDQSHQGTTDPFAQHWEKGGEWSVTE